MKYIFLDLDGTLLNDNKKIDKKTIDYLKRLRKNNYLLGISTGRALSGVDKMLIDLDVYDLFDILICDAGGDSFYPKTNKHVKSLGISKAEIEEVIQAYEDHDEVSILIHSNGRIFSKGNHPMVKAFVRAFGLDFSEKLEDKEFNDTYRIEIFHPVDEKLVAKYRELNFKNLVGLNSDDFLYEYVHKDNSKYKAVKRYVESNGDSLKDVIAIGDGENDIELLKNAKIGIAMKNSPDNVKAHADIISEYDNNNDGVYYCLKDLLGDLL